MASFLARPSSVHPKRTAPVTLRLVGVGTSWTSGSTVAVTNSISGTTTVTKGTWTAVTATTATLAVTTGAGVGTWRLTIDGVASPPLHVRGYRGRWPLRRAHA